MQIPVEDLVIETRLQSQDWSWSNRLTVCRDLCSKDQVSKLVPVTELPTKEEVSRDGQCSRLGQVGWFGEIKASW